MVKNFTVFSGKRIGIVESLCQEGELLYCPAKSSGLVNTHILLCKLPRVWLLSRSPKLCHMSKCPIWGVQHLGWEHTGEELHLGVCRKHGKANCTLNFKPRLLFRGCLVWLCGQTAKQSRAHRFLFELSSTNLLFTNLVTGALDRLISIQYPEVLQTVQPERIRPKSSSWQANSSSSGCKRLMRK